MTLNDMDTNTLMQLVRVYRTLAVQYAEDIPRLRGAAKRHAFDMMLAANDEASRCEQIMDARDQG